MYNERDITFQDGATATGNGQVLNLTGIKTLAIQISGTFAGTVDFEASVDGSNWIAVQLTNRNDGSAATSASAPGLFQGDVAGFALFRTPVSAYTSGAITSTGRGSSL